MPSSIPHTGPASSCAPAFAAALAGIWALITASRIDGDKQPELKTSLVKWSVKWLVPSFVATPFLLIWYLWMVPASQQALLTLGIDTIGSGTFSIITRIALLIIVTSATIVGVAYFLAYRNPLDFNLSHAMSPAAAGADRHRRWRVLPRDAAQALRHRPLDVFQRRPRSIRQPHQPGRLSGALHVGPGMTRPQVTPAAKPSSAASAAPATR
jgi:hypothetical protein